MPGLMCAVATCSNKYTKTKHLTGEDVITYFRFPKDDKLKKIWVEKCRRKGEFNPRYWRVCSVHFTPEDFVRNMRAEMLSLRQTKILKPGVIPTLIADGPSVLRGRKEISSKSIADVEKSSDSGEVSSDFDEDWDEHPTKKRRLTRSCIAKKPERSLAGSMSKGQVSGSKCSIDGCSNSLLGTRNEELNISFYRFPTEQKLLDEWISKCQLKTGWFTKSGRVCSVHFKEEDFDGCPTPGRPFNKRPLKPTAVPSCNLSSTKSQTNIISNKSKTTTSRPLGNKRKSISKAILDNGKKAIEEKELKDRNEIDTIPGILEYDEVIKVNISSEDSVNIENKSSEMQGRSSEEDSDSDIFHITIEDENWSDTDNSNDDVSPEKKSNLEKYSVNIEATDTMGDWIDDEKVSLAGSIDLNNYTFIRNEEGLSCKNKEQEISKPNKFLSQLMKDNDNKIPDKEAIIKIIDEKISEHSKIIEAKPLIHILHAKSKSQNITNKVKESKTVPPHKNNIKRKESETLQQIGKISENLPQVITNKNNKLNMDNNKVIILDKETIDDLSENCTDSNSSISNGNKSQETDLINCPNHTLETVEKIMDKKISEHNKIIAGKYIPELDHTGSLVVSRSKYDMLIKKYETLSTDKAVLEARYSDLKEQFKIIQKDLKSTKCDLAVMSNSNSCLKNKVEKMEAALNKMLTPNQIKLLMNESKKVSWTSQEMLTAFTIRFLSKRCYYILRHKLNYPLPGISSVQRWASSMSKQQGKLEAIKSSIEDCVAQEDDFFQLNDSTLYFPESTDDDVLVEGTLDEINAHFEQSSNDKVVIDNNEKNRESTDAVFKIDSDQISQCGQWDKTYEMEADKDQSETNSKLENEICIDREVADGNANVLLIHNGANENSYVQTYNTEGQNDSLKHSLEYIGTTHEPVKQIQQIERETLAGGNMTDIRDQSFEFISDIKEKATTQINTNDFESNAQEKVREISDNQSNKQPNLMVIEKKPEAGEKNGIEGDNSGNSLLKTLLLEGSALSEDIYNNVLSEGQDVVRIVQAPVLDENGEETSHILLLETVDGTEASCINWEYTDESGNIQPFEVIQDVDEEGNHFIITNESELGQNSYCISNDSGEELPQFLQTDCALESKNLDQKAIAVLNQQIFDENCTSDELLHYLYDASDLNLNKPKNSIDHSYAVATLDKFMRSREKPKNRRIQKFGTNVV